MEVSAFTIGKHLSDLVGRRVDVKLADQANFTPQIRTACYSVEPNQGTAVVKLDFHLLATLGGTMIGVSNSEIDSQVRAGNLDENLTDASRELMNVMAAVIVSEGRAIFQELYSSPTEYSSKAQNVVLSSRFPLKLLVTPSGGKAGYLVIFSECFF